MKRWPAGGGNNRWPAAPAPVGTKRRKVRVMQNRLMGLVEATGVKTDVAPFEIGDTVDVHQRILEGQKERVQVFSGVVISRRGHGMREMFTVRRIVQSEGVERQFPL